MTRRLARAFRPARGATCPGFTLIELLVVSAIVGVVVAVIAACLAGGLRVWDRTRTFAVMEADAVIALRIMERDLMNTFPFYGMRFDGGPTGLSFPGRVTVARPGPDGVERVEEGTRIGGVRYWFDPQQGTLFRHASEYPQGETAAGVAEALLSNLEGVGLQYGVRASQRRGGQAWQDNWDSETNFPARVRIRLTFSRDESAVNITRTVLVPTARTQNSRRE